MKRCLLIRGLLTFSFVLSLVMVGCNSEEKEEFEVKLKTKLTHTPSREHIGTEPASFVITIEANYAITNEMAQVIYRQITPKDSMEWQGVNLQHVSGDSFSARIPALAKGTEIQYYFEITSVTGDNITLPAKAPNVSYRLLFKGQVPRFFSVLHIFLSHIVLILLVLAGFYANRILGQKGSIVPCAWFSLIGLIVFLIGPLLMGIIVNFYTYGQYWLTISREDNGTRLFSLFVLVYWLFTLLSVKEVFFKKKLFKTWIGEQTFAYLTLITGGLYLFISIFAHRL